MKNTVFSYLLWSNPKSSANSEEQVFYDRYASLFNQTLSVFNDNSSLFGIIKGNIVLRGLLNKKVIDENVRVFSVDQLKRRSVIDSIHFELPYLEFKGQKIYIPSYSTQVNSKYGDDIQELKTFPYSALLKDNQASIVDPFETYGNHLFDSDFTKLVKLDIHDSDSNAFYHPNFKVIFVIDDCGGLQQEIPLFDEKLKNPSGDGLFQRLEILMKDYYMNDNDAFLEHLLTLELISRSLFNDLLAISQKNKIRKLKRLNQK